MYSPPCETLGCLYSVVLWLPVHLPLVHFSDAPCFLLCPLKAMYFSVVFHCPFLSVDHRLWNLYSPCMDMPASQEWFQVSLQLRDLLHMILFRHVTFLGRMAYCFHFPVEKTEPGSDFPKVQPRIELKFFLPNTKYHGLL